MCLWIFVQQTGSGSIQGTVQVEKANPVKHEDAFIRSYRFEFAATLKTAIEPLPCVLC